MNARSAHIPARVVEVPVAEARLHVPSWPRGATASVLRGAVCAEMERHAPGGLHVDWHSHVADGTTRQAPALTAYRVHDGLRIHWHGPRAHEHAALLACSLHALRLPGGDVLPVERVDVTTSVERAGASGRRPYVYRLASPLWPPHVAWRRRPRDPGPAQRAWCSYLVAACTREWLRSVGVDLAAGMPVDVHLEDIRWTRGDWREDRRPVFTATIYTPACLPDGIGLGHHRAFGWGEIRSMGRAGWE